MTTKSNRSDTTNFVRGITWAKRVTEEIFRADWGPDWMFEMAKHL